MMTRADGRRCGSFALDNGLCAGHNRLGVTASTEIARAAGIEGNRVKAERAVVRRRQEEMARRGVASALRARVHEHREEMIEALLAPVFDESLGPMQRQKAALAVLTRAFGRPGLAEVPPEGDELPELSLEELVELWSEGSTSPE